MWRFALSNLLSRPVRSLLALLGLTVAIAGMVGLFSVAEGIDKQVSETFGQIPGLVAMQPGAPIPLFSKLPADWEDDIAQVPGVAVVNAEIWERANIIEDKHIFSPPRFLFGTHIPSRLRLRHGVYREAVEEGRFLAAEDGGTPNALVSRQIAEEFGVAVGDPLRVNGHELRIVGIYHTGSLILDVAIIVDIGKLREMSRFDPDSVSAFYIEPEPEVGEEALIARIQSVFYGRTLERWRPSSLVEARTVTGNVCLDAILLLLRKMRAELPEGTEVATPGSAARGPAGGGATVGTSAGRGVTRGNPNDAAIEISSSAQWSERFNKFSADLDLFLTVLTSIGLVIAILSIVNTMLMSVTERIIEFGILKANGWSRRNVMTLITFESAILGVGGGIFGALLGWIGTQVVNATWPDRVQLFASPGLLVFSVFFSTALGVLGGLYPALWAMRMVPMDAIRRG